MKKLGIRRSVAAVGGLLALIMTVAGLTACEPPPNTYVALGDSYTSGPVIPNQSLSPLGCLRSDHNYPHLTSPNIKVTKFVDVSCSGATTKDFSSAQDVTPGPANPPQYDALSKADKVVTVGIGGNDIHFVDIVKDCALENPFGSGCKANYVHDGRDELRERIDALAPKLDAMLAEVKQRAPRAKVFLVGYPTIVPETGNGCYPFVPILPQDTPYLRGVAKYLNSTMAARTAAAGAVYADTATTSVGHDYCAGSNKWVEGIIPTHLAAPVHPNAAGMRNTATVVTAAINAAVPS